MVQWAPEELAGRKHSVGVGADGEERRVAEIEESGEADHDIQADRQQDIHAGIGRRVDQGPAAATGNERRKRSEEHTSELQSPCNLVCRLLLEKKKKTSK